MRRKMIMIPVTILFITLLAVSLQAQDKNKTFSGNFLFGYRYVDTSGTIEKYKEDFNLDKGARLFNFSLHYTPEESLKNLLDRLDLQINNFGGDPFETLSLAIQKYNRYRFQYDRKKSSYFYSDQHEAGGGHLYDLYTLDFDRVSDSGLLKVWLAKNANFYLDFNKYTKKGESVTTFDLNRIEFEFDKPIREDLKEVAVGLSATFLNRYTFLFEERIQEYKNSNSLFLPGYADGGPGAGYPSSLSLFVLSQPYDLDTTTNTFKLTARPFNSLLINGSAQASNQNMDLSYSEEAEGDDFLNRSFAYDYSGKGEFDRKIRLYNFDLTYMLFDRLAIIGAVRYHQFEQDGYLEANGEREDAALEFNTLGLESGLQFQVSSKLGLTLGHRYERRKLEKGIETVAYEEETKRNGFFGNLKYDPSRTFKLTLDYQRGDYENPLTLIGPTDFNRLRLTARIQVKQFNFSGYYLWKDSKSEIYEDLWKSTRNQLNFRAGYQASKFKMNAGYSWTDVEHKGDRRVYYPPSWSGGPGSFLWDILYEGKSTIFDASLSFHPREDWKIGGFAQSYSNTGFWEISRTMLKVYLEYSFENGLVSQFGYRYVDYQEKKSGFNDYSAHILEISFGYRWK